MRLQERGFCYKSLGLALKNKFESNMNNYKDIDESAYEFESLLQALELLVKARECVETIGDISVLYCTHNINTEPLCKRKPKYIQRKKEQREKKGENNFRRTSPQFFLSKDKHLNKVCHRFQIYRNNSNDKFDDGSLWKSGHVQRNVKRLEGYIQYNLSLRQYISLTNEISGDEILIRQIRKCCIKPEEAVSFVLGFSIAGPIAYNVQSTKPSSVVLEADKTFMMGNPRQNLLSY
ncbi:SAMD9 [Mytilus coruscus]|uniref:SAMD9 n=1 Tax=Mytilus coruscus TaxID=42192 RepID=A0A6J8A6S2_MYTCO|nr:SAMD9 [Mytilus coruscus]